MVSCPPCNGTGAVPSGVCVTCGGLGEITAEKAARLAAPTPCECDGNIVPGVLSGDRSAGETVIEYVSRCDECERFPGDLEAALALAEIVGGRVWFSFVQFDDDGPEDVEGTATVFTGGDINGYIEEGTQPWIVLNPVTPDVLRERRDRLLALEEALST